MKCRGCDNEAAPRRSKMGRTPQWCSDRCRKRTLYSVPCERCGTLFGGIANSHAGHTARYCKRCALEVAVEAQCAYGDAVRAEVSALWLEGRLMREIAEIMEWAHAQSVGAYVGRQRHLGFVDEFPVRNEGSSVANKARWAAMA